MLGAWATGMIVSQSLGELCIMKSTGSDAMKIFSTMTSFGTGYHYVILGYPPFLKSLVDDHDFDWDGYTVDAIYGGEAITDQMRDHLSKTFGRVIGSYGASDLEINIAFENEFTIALREAVASDEDLRRELVKDFGSLPSIFQYNPLDYYIESNERNELLFSLNRRPTSPRRSGTTSTTSATPCATAMRSPPSSVPADVTSSRACALAGSACSPCRCSSTTDAPT